MTLKSLNWDLLKNLAVSIRLDGLEAAGGESQTASWLL